MKMDLSKNTMIKGDCQSGIRLIEGLVSYDLIFSDFSYRQRVNLMTFDVIQSLFHMLKNDGAFVVRLPIDSFYIPLSTVQEVVGSKSVNTWIMPFLDPKSRNITLSVLAVYQKKEELFHRYHRQTMPSMLLQETDKKVLFKNHREPRKTILKKYTAKTSRVLDFNANYGETGYVINELNEEDGGQRITTLISDNSNIPSSPLYLESEQSVRLLDESYHYIVLG